jgi:Na+-transporting methylmalonyl-CoA/oxaloacetate decarboxylase gamma subunit
MTIPSWFVILMGMGIVFTGLICIVLICKILSAICSIRDKINCSAEVASPLPAQTTRPAANRQEIIVAIGTAIAEECGVDANAIRIVSIKKI